MPHERRQHRWHAAACYDPKRLQPIALDVAPDIVLRVNGP